MPVEPVLRVAHCREQANVERGQVAHTSVARGHLRVCRITDHECDWSPWPMLRRQRADAQEQLLASRLGACLSNKNTLLVTKIRRACRGSVLLGGLRRSFVTVASRCETRRFDSSAGWHARANERPRTPPLRQSPASPIVSSPPRPPVRALCAALPRDCRAARQPAPSASGRQTIPTRRRGTSAHHGLLRSRDIRARRATAYPQFTTVFRVSCTHAPHPGDDAPHDGRCRGRRA